MSGVYIHIPFCEYKCSYCNFYSIVHKNNKDIYKKYIDYTIKELILRIKCYKEKIETIYLGGGTPSLIGVNLLSYFLKNIIQIINAHNNSKYNIIKEITVETNINDINDDYISYLSSIENIRLSLGIQTFNEKSLDIINRHTTKIDIINSLIDNISLDFICGLPLNSKHQIKDDILFSFDLLPKIKHISLYYLELNDSLKNKWNNILPNDEDTLEIYNLATNTLNDFGLLRYEVSNFALNNFKSIHNSNYWLLKDYIGIGVSAVGCYNNNRYENVKVFKDYFELLSKNQLPIKYNEYLDINIKEKEFIFLSLRTVKGINIKKYNKIFGKNFYYKYGNIIYKNHIYFEISSEYICIRNKYFNYVDEISLILF